VSLLEKYKDNKKREDQETASNNKVVRINERDASSRVSWTSEAKDHNLGFKGELARVESDRMKTSALNHTRRQAHFLMDQLQSAKDELSAFRENHRSLLNQLFTVQRDYKQKIESISSDKRNSEEEYKRLSASFRLKDKDFINVSKRLSDLKENYNKVQFLYQEKINKFKNQYKIKLEDREKETAIALEQLQFEKQQARKRVDDLSKALSDKNVEINSLKAKVDELGNVRETLSSSNKKKHDQAETLTVKIGEYQKKYVSLKNAYDLKNQDISNFEKRIEALTNENLEFHKKIQEFVLDHQESNILSNKQDIRIKNLEMENISLKNVREDRQDLVDMINAYKFKEKELVNDVNNLKAELETVSKDLNRALRDADKFKGRAEALEIEKRTDKKSFEASQFKLEERISIVSDQKQKLQHNIDLVEKELGTYKTNYNSEVKRRQEEKVLSEEISEKYSNIMAEHKEASLKLSEVRSENGVLSKKLIRVQTDTAEIKKELSDTLADLEEMKLQIDDYESLKIQFQDEQISLEMQIVQLTEELKSSRSENNGNIDQISLLTTKMSGLESDVDRLISDKIGLEQKISNLNSVIETEHEKYFALENELSKAVEETNRFKIREVEFVEREQNLKDEKDNLAAKVEVLSSDLEAKETELSQAYVTTDDYLKQQRVLTEEINKLEQQNESLVLRNKAVVEDRDFDSQKYKDLVLEKNGLAAEIEEKSLRIAEINEKVAMQDEKEKRLYSDIEALKKEISQSQKEKETVREELRAEITAIEAKQKNFEKKIKDNNNAYLELELKNQEHIRTIKKYESNILDEKEKGKDFFEKIAALKDEKHEIETKLEERVAKYNDLNFEFEKNNSEIAVLEDKLKNSEGQIKSLSAKNTELNKQVGDKDKLAEEITYVSKQKQALEDQIEDRQNQLDLYSRWVDSQKESLQKHVIRFAQELKASSAISPLKSYLKLTEKELDKVQTALATQKLMGPQRAYMEQHFEQLTQQKNYINELMLKSSADIDVRVREVMGLLKQGEFIPVPPLPPGPGIKS
jgi:chromosome segregation ATPase